MSCRGLKAPGKFMRPTPIILIIVMSGICLFPFAANARATASQNRYSAIPERNIFGLTPTPPPHVPEQPGPPLPKVRLTGITTILGNKRALLKVQFPAWLREPARDKSYILAEGQGDGPIKVLEVDEKLGRVKMDNSGTVMEVTFEKSGLTPATAAASQVPEPNPAVHHLSWSRRPWSGVQTAGR